MPLIILGLFVTAISLMGMSFGIDVIHKGFQQVRNPRPAPWTIVCDDAGEFSYTDWNRRVSALSFPTREAAEAARDERKKWSDDYDAGVFSKEDQNIEARRKARDAKFKPCP